MMQANKSRNTGWVQVKTLLKWHLLLTIRREAARSTRNVRLVSTVYMPLERWALGKMELIGSQEMHCRGVWQWELWVVKRPI